MTTAEISISLRDLARAKGVTLAEQKTIAAQAALNVAGMYNYNREEIKENFDRLLHETEIEAHRLYREHEKAYGRGVLAAFADQLTPSGKFVNASELGEALGQHF